MKARAGGGAVGYWNTRKTELSAGVALVALACMISRPASAAEYHVTDETSFRNTVQAIIDGSDPAPIIILDSDIAVSSTPFPALNKPLTIDTNGNTLSGIDTVTGVTPGASITFDPAAGGALTIIGDVRGGNSAPDAGNVDGGAGLSTSGATVAVTAGSSLTGGQGGDNPAAAPAGAGGTGLILTDGTLVNDGLIEGGAGGISNGGVSGLAGIGVSLTGGNDHVNNGTIRGGVATGPDRGRQGLLLTNGTLTNNGTILGGGSAADPGQNADAVYITDATIINNSTGLIRGADASDPTGNGGNGISALGTGASTIINYGTITGGRTPTYPDGEAAIIGFVGATGDLTIINAGTITGSGGVNNAIRFNLKRGILELHAGSVINGVVLASAGITNDILRLGGDEDDTFDVSAIGSSQQYRNFNIFEKTGTSTWTITGIGSGQAAPWDIYEGTMLMSAGSDLGDGLVDIFGGTLAGVGTVGATTQHANGVIAPGIPDVNNGIGTLTIDGDYAGDGGLLDIQAVLGGDSSLTDLLQINGNTSGSTFVRVTNVGGGGAETVEGIKIVNVDGATSAGTFDLLGDYVVDGEQAVIGGAYAYSLFQGSVSAPDDGDWYLRSILADDGSLIFQPAVPLYEAYAGSLQAFNQLGTLQQRIGNRSWAGAMGLEQGADAVTDLTGGEPRDSGLWARIEGADGHFEPETSTSGTDYDARLWRLQAGLDMRIAETADGTLIGGVNVFYGSIDSDVGSPSGSGSIDSDGYGVGGTLTWYGNSGFYVDGVAQATWYDSDVTSDQLGALIEGNDGTGYGLSVEAGRKIAIAPNWSVTPQAQLAWSSVDFDGFIDSFGTDVSLDGSDSLIGRLGITADYEAFGQDASGRVTRSHFYGIGNLYYDLEDGSTTDVGGIPLVSENEALWGGLGIGGTYNWADDKYSIYGEALARTSLENFGDSHVVSGTVGFRVSW